MDSVDPTAGPAVGGTVVHVYGGQFTTGLEPWYVTFDGIAATNVTRVSNTELTAVTPPHAPGLVDVVVYTLSGGFFASTLTNGFEYEKANVTCNVTGYAVTYDGNAHTATGTCTGVVGEDLSGLLDPKRHDAYQRRRLHRFMELCRQQQLQPRQRSRHRHDQPGAGDGDGRQL